MKPQPTNLQTQIDAVWAKEQRLQQQRWALEKQQLQITYDAFLASNVLAKYQWNYRLWEGRLPGYLQLFGPYDRKDFNAIIPYPHAHTEIIQGVTLNQDDGDITLTFDGTATRIKHFVESRHLKIYEWKNLSTFLVQARPMKGLERFFSDRVERKE